RNHLYMARHRILGDGTLLRHWRQGVRLRFAIGITNTVQCRRGWQINLSLPHRRRSVALIIPKAQPMHDFDAVLRLFQDVPATGVRTAVDLAGGMNVAAARLGAWRFAWKLLAGLAVENVELRAMVDAVKPRNDDQRRRLAGNKLN